MCICAEIKILEYDKRLLFTLHFQCNQQAKSSLSLSSPVSIKVSFCSHPYCDLRLSYGSDSMRRIFNSNTAAGGPYPSDTSNLRMKEASRWGYGETSAVALSGEVLFCDLMQLTSVEEGRAGEESFKWHYELMLVMSTGTGSGSAEILFLFLFFCEQRKQPMRWNSKFKGLPFYKRSLPSSWMIWECIVISRITSYCKRKDHLLLNPQFF